MNCGMNPPLRRKANFKWADSVTGKPKAELLPWLIGHRRREDEKSMEKLYDLCAADGFLSDRMCWSR